MGTANDFASATGIPEAPLEAMLLVLERPATAIDLLRIDAGDEVHWAANLASGGFGTEVTVETSDGMKKLLGGLAYVITGMARLGRIEPVTARFSGPGFAWHGDFIALGIGNGPQAGGGQALCPDALVDDGQLELTIVPTLEGEVGATMATLLADGKHAALDRVAVRTRLPWVEVASDAPITLNLDGEPVTATRFRIGCVAARVRMHLPDRCALLGANAGCTP
jgi:lipid kinase YegS